METCFTDADVEEWAKFLCEEEYPELWQDVAPDIQEQYRVKARHWLNIKAMGPDHDQRNDEAAAKWQAEGAETRGLAISQCDDCGLLAYFPDPVCPVCASSKLHPVGYCDEATS